MRINLAKGTAALVGNLRLQISSGEAVGTQLTICGETFFPYAPRCLPWLAGTVRAIRLQTHYTVRVSESQLPPPSKHLRIWEQDRAA